MAEYGLILALIAIVVIAAIAGLGEKIAEAFNYITGKMAVPSPSQ